MELFAKSAKALVRLVAVGIFIVVIIFAVKGLSGAFSSLSTAQMPTPGVAVQPYPQPYPLPLSTNTPVSPQESRPVCQFSPASAILEQTASRNTYKFSDSEPIPIGATAVRISSWLPDSQNLLITQVIPEKLLHSIVIFNVQTKEQVNFGEGYDLQTPSNRPIWSNTAQGVIFTALDTSSQISLRMSTGAKAGAGTSETSLVTGLADFSFSVDSNGHQLTYFLKANQGVPYVYDLHAKQETRITAELPLPKGSLASYHASWRPNSNQVVFYNRSATYLTNITSGQTCRLELGKSGEAERWAINLKWSPDGRYLAALSAIGEPVVPFIDLTILDMATGELHHHNFGLQYLADVAWAPDSMNLIVIGETMQNPRQGNVYGLFLLDVMTNSYQQVLPEIEFPLAGAWGMSWSPDGSKIALACPVLSAGEPTIAEGRICIIHVELSQ